jgi:phage terminase large subunit-like protein
MENIAETDRKDKSMGIHCQVYLPEDVGVAAKAATMFFCKTLIELEVDARIDRSGGTKSKLHRMQPFLALSEAGFVKVLKDESWNEMLFTELEDFEDGKRNQKDDLWDSVATAAKALMRQNQLPTFSLPALTQPSPVPTIS